MASTSTKLRAVAAGKVTVNRGTSTIIGVSIATIGEAKGHGFELDGRSLDQIGEAIRLAGGVQCRLTHPNGDSVLHLVGKVTNPRRDGNTLRGDLVIGDFAEHSPAGDMKSYLLSLAESQPEHFGLSVVIDFTPEMSGNRTFARIDAVHAVDVVGEPAANRNGLLAKPKPRKGKLKMEYKQILIDEFGLNPSATDEQIKAFVDALSPENKQRIIDAGYTEPTADAPATMSATGGNFATLERKRIGEIRSLASMLPGLDENIIGLQIASGATPEQANQAFLNRIAETCRGIRSINVSEDNRQAMLAAAIPDAVALSTGGRLRKPHDGARMFAGMNTLEIGRRWLESLGANTAGLSRGALAKCLIHPRALADKFGGHVAELAASTGDFTYILANSYSKILRQGYEETPATWSLWAKRGLAPDFKQVSRPLLSEVPTPPAILEGAEYTNANPLNTNEVFTLAKYGHIFSVTWEALVNDDLGAFTSITQKFGAAAKRLEDDLAYVPLTSNQTMTEDSVALFHSSHNNYTTSGAQPTVTTLAIGRALMARQTGPRGAALNIVAKTLLVPVELLTLAEQLVASLVDPSKSNDAINPAFVRGLQVVGEPRLSAASTASWYLAADSNAIDTVEVCFLEGNDAPFIEQQEAFETDGTKFKLRHVVAARALDYRGLYKNNG